MTSQKVIERLKQGNWMIQTATDHELALVLNACLDAKIKWREGQLPNDYIPTLNYGEKYIDITVGDYSCLGYWCYSTRKNDSNGEGLSTITEWFFNETNKDDKPILAPENDREQMLVNALLAMVRDQPLEALGSNGIWDDFFCPFILSVKRTYRLKKQTPLPIPDEVWKLIKPTFKYAAMDENGEVYMYETKPKFNAGYWGCGEEMFQLNAIDIKTDGIEWKLSLTKRPDGL